MVWVLNNEEIREVLDMSVCMEALEEGYRHLGDGFAVSSPRIDLLTPRRYVDHEGRSFPGCHMLKTMSGATPKYAAIRFLTDLLYWREADGGLRRERTPETRNPYSVTRGLILLFSVATGELLAVLAEGHIRNLRVGAAAGLAARYLARTDASRVALLGTGFMAWAHLEAIALVRPVRTVKVYSPNSGHRSRFAHETRQALGLDVEPVSRPEEAVKGSSIVVLATNALNPVIEPSWIKGGMHLTCVRHCEIGRESYAKCDTVVLNSKGNFNVWHYEARSEEGGELPESVLLDYVKGYPPGEVTEVDWKKLPDLPDLLLGRHPGRAREGEITCFDNSVGFGLQFAAVGAKVYEIARERGVGKEAPAEFFPGLVSRSR
jgi:ornithine cyclodeaminase/alanine dehydrogenase-like protein (mu-crystallin family)